MVTTERAKHFYNAQEIPVTLYGDEEEWQVSCSCKQNRSSKFSCKKPHLVLFLNLGQDSLVGLVIMFKMWLLKNVL